MLLTVAGVGAAGSVKGDTLEESDSRADVGSKRHSRSASDQPSLSLASTALDPASPRQYQPVTLAVTLENTGEAAFSGTVRAGGGANSDSQTTVSVPAGETVTATIELMWQAVGSKTVPLEVHTDDHESVLETNFSVEVLRYPEHDIGVDGTSLTCGDGTVHFVGAAPTFTYDPAVVGPANIDVSFQMLSQIGCTAARVWAYSPRWSEQPSIPEPYTYSDAFFEHFDHVVAAAKRHDIRLFAALFNGNPTHAPEDHEEYADEVGTNIVQFVEWADDAEVHNDFFHSEDCRDMYTDWVETVLTHENHITGLEYRNDPTIAMWELGNEIQYGPPRVGDSIRHWIEDVGGFVKSLDEQTLLTTGSYGHQGRNAYVDEASADPIDVASIHYYPGPFHYDLPEEEVIPILEDTVQTTHEEIEKPLYVGEYNWGVSPDSTVPVTERNEWLDQMNEVMDTHDVAAISLWSIVVWERSSDTKPTTVHAASDAGTIRELQHYRDRAFAKSTSSCLPHTDEWRSPPPIVGEDTPRDPDGDELYQDVDGDGQFTLEDVQVLFERRNAPVVEDNAAAFNFSGTDESSVTLADVRALFEMLQE
jgi:mannan endo-1,4-beta-mannosidase